MTVARNVMRGASGGFDITNAKLLASDDTQGPLMSYGSGWWTDDGVHLYTTTWVNEDTNYFTSDLDLTTLAYNNQYVWSNEDVVGVAVDPAGSTAMLFDSGRSIRQLLLNSAFSLSGATVVSTSASQIRTSGNGSYTMYGGTMSRDGQYIFTMGSGLVGVRRYTLATPFVLSSLVSYFPDAGQEVNLSAGPSLIGFPFGMTISHDGLFLRVTDRDSKAIYQWELSTPHDLTTAEFSGEYIDAVNLFGVAGVAAHPSDARIVYALSQVTGITKWRVA
jgi:hypothetical protein